MSKVRVNDIDIYYEERGEGFPLVMIQGLGANLDQWDPRMVRELSKSFKTFTFDNRGAGRTDASDAKYTMRLFADDAAGLMDRLKISRAHVLGLSMGVMIAQETCSKLPSESRKACPRLTNCGGRLSIRPSNSVIGNLLVDRSALSQKEIEQMVVQITLTEDFAKKNSDLVKEMMQRGLKAPISPEAFSRQMIAISGFDTHDRLSQIKAPTLIFTGKKDILVPPGNGSILAEAIPNAKLVYLENSAHTLTEDMDEVINSVTGFLS